MSFLTMYSEVRGSVPKIPLPYCKTLVNRAYRDLCRKNLWSFQLYEASWVSPPMVGTGTATTVQGSDQVVFNATAAAAIIASLTLLNPINQRQFRIGAGTIYGIISFDGVNTITLDRVYQETSATGVAFVIYQIYYPAPYEDHTSFITVKNTVNFTNLNVFKNRDWLDGRDPQRLIWYLPSYVVPFRKGTDPLNLATYRIMLYELWGAPTSSWAYQLYGLRKGLDLVSNSDTLPPPLTEEAVVARAKVGAYEWAEANKGALPRNQGPDFKFLMGESLALYNGLYKDIRKEDRNTVDNWFSVRRSLYGPYMSYYNTFAGIAYPGSPNTGW